MSSSGAVCVYKSIGKTPLDCVREYQKRHPELMDTTISYAGRLDPMAEGLLLLLLGDENKKRRDYEHFDKEYEVDILFGIATDTGDVMGEITTVQNTECKIQREELMKVLNTFVGTKEQYYPAYSALKVQGKPLYWWARQNRLGEVKIPSHIVRIGSIVHLSSTSISRQDLLTYVQNIIPTVTGKFRQHDIIETWRDELDSTQQQAGFSVAKIKVSCGPGTYMRILAEDIGKKIRIPACALTIKRTKIGKYKLDY